MPATTAKTIARFLSATQRRPENIVFLGRRGGNFSGNVKYLYLYFLEKHPQIHCTFVSEDAALVRELHGHGLPAAHFPQSEALEAIAGASVAIADDFHFKENNSYIFTNGAKIVQLWHGVGFKKIGFVEIASSISMTEERKTHLKKMYSDYDAVISTSPFYTENLFRTSFQAKEIWEVGYPRNDVLLRRCSKRDMIGCDREAHMALVEAHKKCKTCLYAPTFRDDHTDPFMHGALKFDKLSKFLREENIFLFLKMHPLSKKYDLENVSNVMMIDNDSDVYPLLPLFDSMVTDYSSIYMDYLHLCRPVIFFPYDKDDYVARLREFQFDYNEMTPGPKCFTQDALHDALGDVVHGADRYQTERIRLQSLAFARSDAQSCARTAEHVLRLAGVETR